MNERIKQLAEQATEYATTRHPLSNHIVLSVNSEKFEEKFAELIVQECAELAKKKAFIIMQKAEEYAADKEEMINATSAAFHLEILEQEIRKHFGVEKQSTEPSESHTCPYAEEIHNDYETLCDCDEEATRQCAMDV
jgi:hypothetical protein